MKNEKKIDILMAVYNGENYITQQIRSIMDQSYRNIHLRIRDNCSQDRTVEIVKRLIDEYHGSISLILSKQNDGIIGNFGFLMAHAQADYMMFADADDFWLKEKVSKTMQKMEELENRYGSHIPLLVHTDLKVVNERLEQIHPSFWQYSRLNPLLPHTLSRQLIQNQVTGCTAMINRPLLRLALPIPGDAAMHDWWLGLCAAAFGKKGVVEEATMLYRQHTKNDTGARKFGLRYCLKQQLSVNEKTKKSVRNKPYEQAGAFLRQYHRQLTPAQINLVQKFIDFKKTSLLKRCYLTVKYQFYPVGLLRKAALITGARELLDYLLHAKNKFQNAFVRK